jgi:DNA replication initiation complex subunit (GINS family)
MLTFEKIRDLEREERENRKLQKLPPDFLKELADYIDRKKNYINGSNDIIELENIKKTARRIFEIREEKVAQHALYTAKTGFPPENLTDEEEALFSIILKEIKRYREWFFASMDKGAQTTEKADHAEKGNPDVRTPQEKGTEERSPAAPRYRVLKSIPKFVGPDLHVYELKEDQILEALPTPLNDLLLKRGIVEKIA